MYSRKVGELEDERELKYIKREQKHELEKVLRREQKKNKKIHI